MAPTRQGVADCETRRRRRDRFTCCFGVNTDTSQHNLMIPEPAASFASSWKVERIANEEEATLIRPNPPEYRYLSDAIIYFRNSR